MHASRLGRLGRLAAALVLSAPVTVLAAPGAATAETVLCVSVIVDFNSLDQRGAPAQPSAFCAKVPDGSTGADVLAVRARELGKPAPRYDSQGLLCAIDGFPETGCAQEANADGSYDYWSYWHRKGDGGWSYSNRGAYGYRMSDDPATPETERFTEGWAWTNDQRRQPPPTVAYGSVCPTDPPPKSSTPSTAPRPTAPRPAAGPAKPAPQPARVATAAGAAPATATPRPTLSATATTTATATATAAPAATTSASASATPVRSPDVNLEVAEPPTRTADDGGVPIAPIAGGALAAALFAGAVLQARRRRT